MIDRKRLSIDDAVLRRPLKSLCTNVEDFTERAFPISLSSIKWLQYFVVANIKISRNTWAAARYMCVDNSSDPDLKRDFFITAFPLARTILELLFSMVLIFDNPTENIRWYFHSSWREDYEEHQRRKKKYGDQSDWKEFLTQRETVLLKSADELGIYSSTINNVDKIKRWPNPGKMATGSKIVRDPKRKELFEYLNEWYYHSLSAASHQTGSRLIPAMHLLSGAKVTGPYAFRSELYKSEAVSTIDILLMAILSEFIIEMGLQKVDEAKYIWTILCETSLYAKGLYKLRYQSLLKDK